MLKQILRREQSMQSSALLMQAKVALEVRRGAQPWQRPLHASLRAQRAAQAARQPSQVRERRLPGDIETFALLCAVQARRNERAAQLCTLELDLLWPDRHRAAEIGA